ncbi:type II 3-dehydroquinate dehydratase [Tenacibaculum finnmarkense genomovar ulcerans]|uniref:type II 3-dehydroquinate dehydratase n=1 Tax=Tenacibaculum finnmarkense TaxID=2781243 RepID=UPI00187B7FBD|nr:type II 3-dehydroquinate dehydratase [Tenacibaculum finnmarkense]MBE7687520.1 type II 3-dehydroquinate dehydratase [Tenacibaculum finnmarkense genomovar ulcerans]
MKKIIIINGPNLNLLGKREPEIYGSNSFDDFFKELKQTYKTIELSYFQSNIEGELINKLHEIGFQYDGIVLNAAAYTHTSIAIADAVKTIETPVVEVHISNVHAREAFRHKSYLSANAKGVILGFGLQSYNLAIQSFL